jgi:hypothetical protein
MAARLTELTVAPALRRRRFPASLVVGRTLVLTLVVVAVLAQWIAPYPYDQMHIRDRFMPPNLHYLVGTDEYGRDVFSRLLFGSQLSLALGVTHKGMNHVDDREARPGGGVCAARKGHAEMVWTSAFACGGDLLLRRAGCQGKDLIATVFGLRICTPSSVPPFSIMRQQRR